MKKILSLLTFALLALTASSCGSDSSDDGGGSQNADAVTLSAEAITFAADGGSQSVTVTATREWGVQSGYPSWLTFDRESGFSGATTITLKAAANDKTSAREADIVIMAGSTRKHITVKQEAGAEDLYPAPEGYELVWHDEFNAGSELNAADWTHEVQSSGWVNNELQNYVNHKTPAGASVTEINNGTLKINCLKENGKIYSGRVYAHVSEGWQYGYIEARIKLPSGKGTWPAFWMMPADVDWTAESWPGCGEIDIMEEVGCVPNEVSSSLHADGHNHTNNTQITSKTTISKAEGAFHTYAIKWTAQNITTYVDGTALLSYDNDGTGKRNWPYSRPFYVILNLAWGGSWGGKNGVNESALPVTMEVDYVRVFQKK